LNTKEDILKNVGNVSGDIYRKKETHSGSGKHEAGWVNDDRI